MTISVTLVHADHASEVADILYDPLTAPSYSFSSLRSLTPSNPLPPHASEVADILSHPLTAPSYSFSPLIPCDLLL